MTSPDARQRARVAASPGNVIATAGATPSKAFRSDAYPGAPKVLFVGHAESTHTHAWIDLLAGEAFNVRLFALPTGIPPHDWPVRTYVTATTDATLDPITRARLYASDRVRRFPRKGYARFLLRGPSLEDRWLARVIAEWSPDVIHTLGLEPASAFYHRVRDAFGLESVGRWVVHIWGGADLMLARFDPEVAERARATIMACDQLLDDNPHGLRIARELGARDSQIASIGTVPGTGGIDIGAIRRAWDGKPSSRRLILWPKAYDCPWSKALPVLEALMISWDRLAPCEVHMLAAEPDTKMWIRALPEHIRRHCHVSDRIPRSAVLDLMSRARVMLAPSLVDGMPNTLLEAMAAGALPIVSPLETIAPFARDGHNVLHARNLYPTEIASALERAMNDDALVDSAAEVNAGVVARLADRSAIAPRVREWYSDLAATSPERAS